MSLYTHQESNKRKTWLLFTVFFVVVIAIGWVFAQIYQSSVILYFAVAFSVGMSVTSYWFSDKIALRTAHAKPVSRENARELYNIVENLAITAGLPMPRVYLIDDKAPNAFATGRNPEHAVIAVTTGLVHILDRSELEGVIAHELSHIGNRDMFLSTVAVVLVGFVALLSDMFLRSMFWGSFGGNRDGGRAGGVILLIGIALAILSPIIASIMQLAISRKREFLADASGAMLTRYPDGLARALEKISNNHSPMRHANNATAHLYISNPFKGKTGKHWFAKMFMTHPPLNERIQALRGMRV